MNYPRAKSVGIVVIALSGPSVCFAQAVASGKNAGAATPVELSPFLVEEETDQGYYASQTLAGGR